MFDLQRPQLIHIGPGGRKLSRVASSARPFYTTCNEGTVLSSAMDSRRHRLFDWTRQKTPHKGEATFLPRSRTPFFLLTRFTLELIGIIRVRSIHDDILRSVRSSFSLFLYIIRRSFFNPDTRCYGMVDRRSALVIRITRTSAVIRRWIFSSLVFVRDVHPALVALSSVACENRSCRRGGKGLLDIVKFFLPFKREISLD